MGPATTSPACVASCHLMVCEGWQPAASWLRTLQGTSAQVRRAARSRACTKAQALSCLSGHSEARAFSSLRGRGRQAFRCLRCCHRRRRHRRRGGQRRQQQQSPQQQPLRAQVRHSASSRIMTHSTTSSACCRRRSSLQACHRQQRRQRRRQCHCTDSRLPKPFPIASQCGGTGKRLGRDWEASHGQLGFPYCDKGAFPNPFPIVSQ